MKRILSILLFALSISANAQTYCSPSFTSGCIFNNYISAVSVGGMSNTATGCTVSNYTSMVANVTSGVATPMTITCAGWDGVVVWVDLNNDGDFTDANELLYNHYQAFTPPITYNFNITIPSGTPGGLHRMRVMCGNGGSASGSPDPCKTIAYGNFHDYTVNIPPSLPNDAGVSNIISPVSDCDGSVQNVQVEVKNFGVNQINNVEVHWKINGLPQPTYTYSSLLDTVGGTGPNTAVVTIGSITMQGGVTKNLAVWTELPNGMLDMVAANDSSLSSVTGYNFPTVDLGNDTSTCPNNLITLDAGSGRDSVIWGHGPKTQTVIANTSMTYMVDVWKNGCMGGDTINVTLFPAPPSVNLGNDTTICYGDILTLNATASGVTYLWQDNSTSATYPADTAGLYFVSIEDVNSCKNTDTIEVKLYKDPSVTMFVSPSTTFCFGSNVIFQANGKTEGSERYQLVVNNVNSGSPQTSPIFNNPTVYFGDSVRIDLLTDQCAVNEYAVPSNQVKMTINPMPRQINGLTTDTVLENTKKSYAVTGGANSSYVWRVKGGSIIGDSTTFAVQIQWAGANPNALLTLVETDASNCSRPNELPVNVISIEGMEDYTFNMGEAYPNPSDESVTLPIEAHVSGQLNISLFDITGKQISTVYNDQIVGSKKITISTFDLENGVYFINASYSNGYKVVKKLIVRH